MEKLRPSQWTKVFHITCEESMHDKYINSRTSDFEALSLKQTTMLVFWQLCVGNHAFQSHHCLKI